MTEIAADKGSAPAKAETPAVSTKDMAAYLRGEGEAPVAEQGEAGDEPAAVDASAGTEKAAQPADEDKVEADPKDSEKDDDEKADEKDGKSRPSRYQRLKARAEQAEKTAHKVATDLQDAIALINAWRTDASHWKERYEAVRTGAAEKGYQEDPREAEIAELKRKLTERETREAADKARREAAIKAEVDKARNEYRVQFQTEARELVKQHPSLTEKQLLMSYALALEAGEDVTLSDVAMALAPIAGLSKNKHRSEAAREQTLSNRAAPKTLAAGKPARADYPPTRDGMAAFLRSIGQE